VRAGQAGVVQQITAEDAILVRVALAVAIPSAIALPLEGIALAAPSSPAWSCTLHA
jgi:hypothetical protein